MSYSTQNRSFRRRSQT